MDEKYKGTLMEQSFIEKMAPLVEAYSRVGTGEVNFIDNPHAPPLKNNMERAVMAQMLENTKQYMCFEEFRADVPIGELLETTTPIKTTAWSGATMIPIVLGFVRKLMPKMIGLELVQTQPMQRPTGRVFYIDRKRHEDGTTDGIVEARAGWSYRSWIDDPGEASTIIKSVDLTFTSADVTAKSHKLKTELSAEFQMDLQAYLGMDAVALASDTVTDEFAMELDELLLHQLYHNRGQVVYFGSKPSGYTMSEWDRRLIEAFVRGDELAYNRHRTRTNWIVCGSEMSVQLQRMATFDAVPEGDRPVVAAGLVRIGTLNSRWRVYEMPLPWPSSEALMGYVGTNWSDALLFYLPYLPLTFYGRDRDVEKLVDTLTWWSRFCTYMPTNASRGLSLVVLDATNYTGMSYPDWSEWAG